jgi:hypothetical protein
MAATEAPGFPQPQSIAPIAGARNHEGRAALPFRLYTITRRSAGAHTKMIEVDEAAVLLRAKAIAAEDGFTWQLDFDAHGARLRGLHFLSEDRRRQYLARARDEFRKKAGAA